MSPEVFSLAIPGWRQAGDGLYSAGQPESRHWPALAAAGLRSVLNLRPAAEQPARDESQEVADAGLVYAALPIADASALGRESAAALDRALRELPAPLLLHCASGNRVGALVALREAWFNGGDAWIALSKGRDAGLAGLEPQVRRLLDLPEAH